jgi:hypothetical protein
MGIHTWFEQRIDLTFEEAQKRAINNVTRAIELFHKYGSEKAHIDLYEKYLESIKKGDHYLICLNLFDTDKDNRYSYSGYGFGILIETEYDDTFRMSYDDFGDRKAHYESYEFHSLDETIAFLDALDPLVKENDYKFPDGYLDKIKEFWEKYPSGQIHFC